jgi:hypothetical protein
MYSIKNARKDKHDGKIIHEIPGQDDKTYLSIRAGLSWPNKSAPAYYCILGQEDRQNQFKRNPIAFFYEGQSKNLNLLLDKLTDHAKMVLCEQIWVDLTGFFYRLLRGNRNAGPLFETSPLAGEFFLWIGPYQ